MSASGAMGGHAQNLTAELRQQTGLNAAACYQCGKCSAGCPMVGEGLRPHDVLRAITGNRRDSLLADPSIWLCLTCETCTQRCPNSCDPARLLDGLRELAAGRAPRSIDAFHRSFLAQIKATGRMFELGLVLQYKLRSGALLQDAASTPALLRRGKLKLKPTSIKGIEDVRRIFKACEEAEGGPR